MKYVLINGGQPGGGFVLVSDEATGGEIKREAKRQGLTCEEHWQLQGHNANGANFVIGEDDVTGHHDFTLIDTRDNA